MTSAEKELHSREEAFHDAWGTSIEASAVLVDESFTACTAPEGRLIAAWLGDVRGKSLLDLGCGAGEAAVFFAKKGAQVTALDISSEMLAVVKQVAAHHHTSVETCHSAGEKIPFPDNHFDIVYAANYLHHVPVEDALGEIQRVLKPGGTLLSWDPLRHNPIINLYRRMAHQVRTPDEHPLAMSELSLFKKLYGEVRFETRWLCTLWIFLRFYLIDRVHPNSERYWKKILHEHTRLEREYNFLESIDHKLLKLLPFLRRYCWNIVVYAKKA